ncbi:MAG: hypothetical protein HC857_01560 [Synechococcales cyanobacterium RU_4_20]|nr:hypothetical protein [Synechococcales cyanobacterium RU_4_20]NJR68625.1 hypothetical protein [Synechococcales cyanobacterium CRU_2_2]
MTRSRLTIARLPMGRMLLGVCLPMLAGTLAIAAPAGAASFADSSTRSELFNFALNGVEAKPFFTDTDTNTDTIVLGGVSAVGAISDAKAVFEENPGFASGLSEAAVQGTGPLAYLGRATATAEALGSFHASGLFTFDFSALLDLESLAGESSRESALALGDIRWSLFAETEQGSELLDYFSLSGLLASRSDPDSFEADFSDRVTLSPLDCGLPGGSCVESFFAAPGQSGNREFARAVINGRYQREFTHPTVLRLVQAQQSLAGVEAVPEASNILALGVLGLGLGGMRRFSR